GSVAHMQNKFLAELGLHELSAKDGRGRIEGSNGTGFRCYPRGFRAYPRGYPRRCRGNRSRRGSRRARQNEERDTIQGEKGKQLFHWFVLTLFDYLLETATLCDLFR